MKIPDPPHPTEEGDEPFRSQETLPAASLAERELIRAKLDSLDPCGPSHSFDWLNADPERS